MKKLIVALFCATAAAGLFTSCDKTDAPPVVTDYRDTLAGTYTLTLDSSYIDVDNRVLKVLSTGLEQVRPGSDSIVNGRGVTVTATKSGPEDFKLSYQLFNGELVTLRAINLRKDTAIGRQSNIVFQVLADAPYKQVILPDGSMGVDSLRQYLYKGRQFNFITRGGGLALGGGYAVRQEGVWNIMIHMDGYDRDFRRRQVSPTVSRVDTLIQTPYFTTLQAKKN